MKHFLINTLQAIENTPLTLGSFTVAFFALIVTRLGIESALGLFETRSFFFYFFEFTHTFLFFLCSFLILLPLVRCAGNTDLKKAANILLFGFLVILTPPIIDTLIFRGAHFWSFYEFDGFTGLVARFFTLFGDTPNIGITYGVRVEVVLTSLLLGLYTFLKSRSAPKALGVSFLAYSVLFILGTFPSWITLGVLFFQKSLLSIGANDVAALFLSPENIFTRQLDDFRSVLNAKMSIVYAILAVFLSGLLLWWEYRTYFIALWKNARMPQLVYHGGLLLLGMLLACFFSETYPPLDFFHIGGTLVLIAAVESAWLASVVTNDLYDIRIDVKTNPDRPLIKHSIPPEIYRIFGVLFFLTSLILSGILSFSAMLLLLAYQSLAWTYSAPPFRLKRFPVIATLLAAAAGLLVLVVGYLVVSPDGSLRALPLPILLFLFVTYALILPLKDLKDVDGDRADRVYTIPVIFGIQKTKLFIGGLIFLSSVASTFILNIRQLFLPALLIGSLSFWVIQKSDADETSLLSFRRLPIAVLALIVVYGFLIVFSLS